MKQLVQYNALRSITDMFADSVAGIKINRSLDKPLFTNLIQSQIVKLSVVKRPCIFEISWCNLQQHYNPHQLTLKVNGSMPAMSLENLTCCLPGMHIA